MSPAETNPPVTGWMVADLQHSVLGTVSRLGEPLGDSSVLGQCCRRAAAARRLDRLVIFCPASQRPQIDALVSGLDLNKPLQVVNLDYSYRPGRRLTQRKWGLNSWRGGMNESVWVDEWLLSAEMINFGLKEKQEHILFLPPDGVMLDPALLDELIALLLKNEMDMRLAFCQAAPGLAGIALKLDLIYELHQANASVSHLLGYHPDSPHSDYIMHDCCLKIDSELYRTPYRYLTDTRRSYAAIQEAWHRFELGRPENWPAARSISAMDACRDALKRFPREIEIELNTEPSARIAGYPHGSGRRLPMTLERFKKIIADCAGWDDICLTLGGFGEATAHPQLAEMIGIARAGGILGIHLETDGLLTEIKIEEIVKAAPDLISVYLDANSPQLYRQVKGRDGFEQAVQSIHAIQNCRRTLEQAMPLVAPHLVKIRPAMTEMEAFYDYWKKQCGAAVIEGHNDFAGQIPAQEVMNMAPPRRRPCRRLQQRLMILADGQVSLCSQDFAGLHPLGHVDRQSLAEIWNGPALRQLWQAHHQENFAINPLCEHCREWHRG